MTAPNTHPWFFPDRMHGGSPLAQFEIGRHGLSGHLRAERLEPSRKLVHRIVEQAVAGIVGHEDAAAAMSDCLLAPSQPSCLQMALQRPDPLTFYFEGLREYALSQ